MTTADELMTLARVRTGLRHFGTDSFHDGLVALVDGAEAAGSFNELAQRAETIEQRRRNVQRCFAG